jgi:hypothetical protein
MQTSRIAQPTAFPTTAPTAVRVPTQLPAPPFAGATQTDIAKASLTRATRAVLPDTLLDAKIGKGTLAGALNDQVRFRVDRTGDDPATWAINTDSPAAEAVMQSRSGADLMRQLRTAVNGTRDLGRLSNLKGFMLTKDSDGVLAGTALAAVDSKGDPKGAYLARLAGQGRTDKVGRSIREDRAGTIHDLASAGAWNSDGWITFMPDVSRMMLTATGAYRPDPKTEANVRRATSATYVAGNASHEVQHSVSTPTASAYVGDARWMEEGTANVMARTPVFLARQERSSNVFVQRYAGKLAHPAEVDLGWSAWKRPSLGSAETAKTDKEADRNYGDSQVTLRALVRLAGGDFRSAAGQQKAFHLLQDRSMRFTPGVLAKAIIQEHGLDASVYERLRTRIAGAVDIEGGVDALAREFGIRGKQGS